MKLQGSILKVQAIPVTMQAINAEPLESAPKVHVTPRNPQPATIEDAVRVA
jgi:hypothetical protein